MHTRLALDLMMAALLVVANNPPLTGAAVHEWLAALVAAPAVAHVVLNWDVAARMGRRWRAPAPWPSRLRDVVSVCLFVAMTATILSGAMLSRHLVPALGLVPVPGPAWREVHSWGANLMVIGAGIHLGLHWDWVTTQVSRLRAWAAAPGQDAWSRTPPAAHAAADGPGDCATS